MKLKKKQATNASPSGLRFRGAQQRSAPINSAPRLSEGVFAPYLSLGK